MKKSLYILFILSLGFCFNFAFADDAEPSKAEEKASEEKTQDEKAEEPQKKIKGKRKVAEYKEWKVASSVAESWEQPVITFVFIQGDKTSSRFRMETVAHGVSRALFGPNATLYVSQVPQSKNKNKWQYNNVNNRNNRDQESVEGDFDAVKKSERELIMALKAKNEIFPQVAVVTPDRKILGTFTRDEEDNSFTRFVDFLKETFEKGGYKLEIPSQVQRILRNEEKSKMFEEKMRNK